MLRLATRGSRRGAGRRAQLANSRLRPPLHFHFPRREEPEPDVQRQGTAGESPRPARAPSLPSPPVAPPGPAPTCLPRDSPAGRPEGGWLGRRAGGRRGYPAPDMAHPTRAPLPPGRRMKEEEVAEGAGAQGALEGDPSDPSVPAALRHAGTVLPRRSLAPRGPPGSCRAEGPVLLRAPRFLRSPQPPLRDHGRRRSPPPRPAAVTLAAPAQRPTAYSATPGGWEGPLHPGSFPPPSHCRTLTLGGP